MIRLSLDLLLACALHLGAQDGTSVATRDRRANLLRTLSVDSVNGIDRVIDASELRHCDGFP